MSALSILIKNASDFVSLQPADSLSIKAAENELGLHFAPDYKDYLSVFGVASFDGKELTGICKSERLSVVYSTKRVRQFYSLFPQKAYVIEDLGFDHVYIIQDSSGKVYSYGPSDSAKMIAESLQDYLFPDK